MKSKRRKFVVDLDSIHLAYLSSGQTKKNEESSHAMIKKRENMSMSMKRGKQGRKVTKSSYTKNQFGHLMMRPHFICINHFTFSDGSFLVYARAPVHV